MTGLVEFLGTMFLTMVVVGSGVMAENLANGNLAVALLANSVATGAGLFLLIQGGQWLGTARFNPVMSLLSWLDCEFQMVQLGIFVLVQVGGAILGVFLVHLMFGLPIIEASSHDRSDFRFLFSEFIATFGLVFVAKTCPRQRVAASVALYIVAAYWFTASTAFANPALTLARACTATFAGLTWASVPGFFVAQWIGGWAAWRLCRSLTPLLDEV